MTFLDLFAGIGGFRLALERAGHTCVGFCEIDKFARQTYKANFNTEGEVEWHDITSVTDDDVRKLGRVDIITGGFPCQAFSVAGKRGGFDDTRGTLFFEIARIARILKPKYLLLENVKGLLNHAGGTTFTTILNTLGELGYWVEWQILNSAHFGVPQNRERVFIVGHFGGEPRRKVFPITRTNGQALKQLIGGQQGYRVYGPSGTNVTLASQAGGMGGKTGLYAIPVLTPDRLEKRQNGRRFKEPGEPMFTLTAQDRHGVLVRYTDDGFHLARNDEKKSSIQGTHVTYPQGKSHCLGTSHVPMTIEGVRIRRLTPLECFRLQGFPDEHFHNAKAAGVSDSQLYKQAGNAVTVNVVYEIAKRLG